MNSRRKSPISRYRTASTFFLIERHEAPVISFHTYVNVGSVDDPGGQTGLAHMFEHMAFKGTPTIGTKNWPEEKKALDTVDAAYTRLDEERGKGRLADPQKLKKLADGGWSRMSITTRPESFVEPNESMTGWLNRTAVWT